MSEPTAWPQIPDEDTRITAAPLGNAAGGAAHRRRATRIAIVLAVAAPTAAAGAASWVAFTNKDRADRWEARSSQLQSNVYALNALVIRRTALLNARGAQLNVMARKVTRAQNALSRSEGDVASLEVRQRQLANEKAQLEDERAALTEVASAFITCKGDLENVIQAVGNSDYAWIETYADTIDSECSSADSSLQSFLAAYPNG